MKCINCRCVIPDSSDYCVYCGHAVEKDSDPTYPVRSAVYPSLTSEPTVFHSYAACDDPNQFYGIPEENDGSDAYDSYYESDYIGYGQYWYPDVRQSGEVVLPDAGYYDGIDLKTLLWCFAGLDFIIIILLVIILLLMLL